ncbi:MAG: hypothetical protein JW982_02760 [Spirochaetes bacterium]|nr:hypothetical protein [Spirochaetota bacterium]
MNISKFELLRKNYKRNAFSISAVEFFWGLGMPVFVESTFLQLFLRKYNASHFVVGLVPVFLSIGVPVFSLTSVYVTKHFINKKYVVSAVHIFAAVPLFLFGLFMNFDLSDKNVVYLFLLFYGLFSLGIGMTLPVWQNFIVRVFNEEDAIRGLAVMGITQNVTKILSAFIILKAVSVFDISRTSVSFIFTAVGLILISGSLFFLLSAEFAEADNEDAGLNGLKWFLQSFKTCIKNRNFLMFLGNDTGFLAGTVVISFYGNYASELCGIENSVVAGLFAASGFSAGIISQLIFGYFDFLKLKQKYYAEKFFTFTGILILIMFSGKGAFLAASFMIGAGRSIRTLAFPHAMKKISGKNDATGYFGIAPILTLPLTAGLPVAAGNFLDMTEHTGSLSYRILFSSMAFIVLLSLFFISKTNFSNRASVNGFGIRNN